MIAAQAAAPATTIHANLKQLSNSSTVVLHKCPRRFELDKLLPRADTGDYHTAFGHLVGTGIQERLVTGDRTKAAFKMFTSWQEELEPEDQRATKDKKTFWHGLIALDKFEQLCNQQFSNFEIAYLNDAGAAKRPAIELGFSIDCGEGFFYRGFIDAVMICRRTGNIVVIECKTTKFSQVHEAQYKHSGQALGYSLIIDAIIARLELQAKSSYQVYYPVYKSSAVAWDCIPFTKTSKKRATWIKDILLDIQYIKERAADEYFPMRGESCYDFFRPCPHFDVCEFGNSTLIGSGGSPERVEETSKYDFHFSLAEIIDAQLAAHGE